MIRRAARTFTPRGWAALLGCAAALAFFLLRR
jgi:hypothetical protein